MEYTDNIKEQNESTVITDKDFMEFLSASGKEQFELLLAHAERNKKIIQIRRLKTMEQNNTQSYDEISKQFEEFCHTKGIAAKFKLAFEQMAENAHKQHEADKAEFEARKAQSAEENKEFVELLHTKGIKAKVKLIIENIKRGAKESNEKVRKQIAQSKHGVHAAKPIQAYSAEDLSREFNAFLKARGLDGKYVVEVADESDD